MRSALVALLFAAGCGASPTGKVMADHPVYEYQPPPEVAEAEDDDEDLDDDLDDEDDTDGAADPAAGGDATDDAAGAGAE